MVHSTKDLDLDKTVALLKENELGILLIQADGEKKNLYDVLLSNATYKDRQGMFGNGENITYHLYPLMYHKKHDSKCTFAEERDNAISNVFKRWKEKGYNKTYLKNPYGCNTFIAYLDSIAWSSADYMLLMVH